jgi:hypothetical protein
LKQFEQAFRENYTELIREISALLEKSTASPQFGTVD